MMKTPEYSYPRLRNLGIFLLGSALIAGCAGNHVEPASPDSATQTTSKLNNAQTSQQFASQNPALTTDRSPTDNDQEKSGPVISQASTPGDQSGNATDKSDINKTASADTVLEPAQTTFYFGVNQYRLSPQEKSVIAQHARFLKANPSLVLEINGHTDSSGSHVYNAYLSKKRAEAVASLLIQDGVKRSQLVIKALADSKPIASTNDPDKNRRVELQYDDMSMLSSK